MLIPGQDRFGIVIDAGSSGSRVQVYRWQDPAYVRQQQQQQQQQQPPLPLALPLAAATALRSPPVITQEHNWTFKTNPGISTYHNKVHRLWRDHLLELVAFAARIVPRDRHRDTPIFVLATAGMRLLQPRDQAALLAETCRVLRRHTNFYLPSCRDFVQVIDGETEGLYGWIGLNYLMGQFNDYDASQLQHDLIGFMDMGGALTQIAFVPSSPQEATQHQQDLLQVTLRNVNGETQTWRVFVETWLGFGANEARRRYLDQLIGVYAANPHSAANLVISDPCLPRGADLQHTVQGRSYTIHGMGDYQLCVKTIYPLLLKNIPCLGTPCLFNGIHGPRLNFDHDRFIGISEYWYTANDIFQSGGEYNYHAFNAKVKEFCESDWLTILANAEKGAYSNLDPEKFLKTACFKASWVMNVLHEGFELPRLELDDIPPPTAADDKLTAEVLTKHTPFKLANSVNGDELSWTLGRILLFALSQIEPTTQTDDHVGVYGSANSGLGFVPGGGLTRLAVLGDYEGTLGAMVYPVLVIVVLVMAWLGHTKGGVRKLARLSPRVRGAVHGFWRWSQRDSPGWQQEEVNYSLEEGLRTSDASLVLRTRSAASLPHEVAPDRYTPSFLHKPFVVPKRGAGVFMMDHGSRDALVRSASTSSMRTKGPD